MLKTETALISILHKLSSSQSLMSILSRGVFLFCVGNKMAMLIKRLRW